MKKIIKKSIAFVLAVMITLTSSSVYSAAEIPEAPETYVTEDGIEVDSSISSSEISDMPEDLKLENILIRIKRFQNNYFPTMCN